VCTIEQHEHELRKEDILIDNTPLVEENILEEKEDNRKDILDEDEAQVEYYFPPSDIETDVVNCGG
jgi:Pyruvate/2-oxoacid:ferredoxin oxidoreductase gamma subunit